MTLLPVSAPLDSVTQFNLSFNISVFDQTEKIIVGFTFYILHYSG